MNRNRVVIGCARCIGNVRRYRVGVHQVTGQGLGGEDLLLQLRIVDDRRLVFDRVIAGWSRVGEERGRYAGGDEAGVVTAALSEQQLSKTVSNVDAWVAARAAATRLGPPVSAPTSTVTFLSDGEMLVPCMSKFT